MNEHEDYYNQKNNQRFIQFQSSMIGVVILCVIFGLFSFGWLTYKYVNTMTAIKGIPCSGYTVIDYERVVRCDGDTVVYDWHWDIRKGVK